MVDATTHLFLRSGDLNDTQIVLGRFLTDIAMSQWCHATQVADPAQIQEHVQRALDLLSVQIPYSNAKKRRFVEHHADELADMLCDPYQEDGALRSNTQELLFSRDVTEEKLLARKLVFGLLDRTQPKSPQLLLQENSTFSNGRAVVRNISDVLGQLLSADIPRKSYMRRPSFPKNSEEPAEEVYELEEQNTQFISDPRIAQHLESTMDYYTEREDFGIKNPCHQNLLLVWIYQIMTYEGSPIERVGELLPYMRNILSGDFEKFEDALGPLTASDLQAIFSACWVREEKLRVSPELDDLYNGAEYLEEQLESLRHSDATVLKETAISRLQKIQTISPETMSMVIPYFFEETT